MTDAYAELHELGVVHGDVHPGNVLVSATGAVRLVDFGLARLVGARQPCEDPPRGGVQAFFDPEFASAIRAGKRPQPASPVSDQYSLGALLYELLTGSGYLDFSLDNDEMLGQIVEEDPLPFARRAERPWPEVEDLLSRALAKDPTHRLSSVAELGRRLAAVVTPAPASRVVRSTGQSAGVEPVLRSVLAKARPGGEWFEHGVPTAPFCSVAYGAAGVAAALHRVGLLRADPELIALADEWVVRAARDAGAPGAFTSEEPEVTDEITGRVTPLHRASGVHAVQVLVSHAIGDPAARQQALDAFVAESRQPCDNLDLTLGRCGTLLGAAILMEAIIGAPYADTGRLTDLGNDTLTDVWSRLDAMPSVAEGTAMTYLGRPTDGLVFSWPRFVGAGFPVRFGRQPSSIAWTSSPRWLSQRGWGSAGLGRTRRRMPARPHPCPVGATVVRDTCTSGPLPMRCWATTAGRRWRRRRPGTSMRHLAGTPTSAAASLGRRTPCLPCTDTQESNGGSPPPRSWPAGQRPPSIRLPRTS